MGMKSGMKIAVTLAAAALIGLLAAAPAGASSHPLALSGHAAFGSCGARDAEYLVAIPRRTFKASQPVTVNVVVKDVGSTSCVYSGATVQPEMIGPCGTLQLQVDNRKGLDLWPDHAAFSCPMEVARTLAPGAEIRAAGTWDQRLAEPSNRLVPRGSYRLIVAGKFSFAIVLR
jgi:hypothetical protein